MSEEPQDYLVSIQYTEEYEPGPAPPPIVSLIAGSLLGGIESFITYPFEFAKTRAQLKHDPLRLLPRNPYHILSETVRYEGRRALYKGCNAVVIGSMAKDAVRFGSFDTIKTAFQDQRTGQLTPGKTILAGMASGVAASVFAVTPTERVKTALIDDARADKRFRSAWSAVISILREDGPKGLYRGFIGTTLKQASTTSFRLGSYNIIKDTERSSHIPQNSVMCFINGAIAGFITTLATQPFDTLKTRSQVVKATTTMEAFRNILRDGGLIGFWDGTVMRLSRTVVSGGIMFMVYELVVKEDFHVSGFGYAIH